MPSDADRPRPPEAGRILELPGISAFFPLISRPLAATAVDEALSRARERIAAGETPSEAEVAEDAGARCASLASRRLRRALNGTGVLLRADLGRAPLGREAWAAAESANAGYCSLESDPDAGARGGRGVLVAELAARLAGAEAALVLNNGAAAVLLALTALAKGREVLVSRGEQVQIGGGFRIPEILALSGALPVEVGTTNVTAAEDYLRAAGPRTACALSVLCSDFAMRGSVARPAVGELASALPEGIPLVVDEGSGRLDSGGGGEPTPGSILRDGAALVCFSADKLLGGPQAGIAAGRADLVAAMAAHPLARALRPGKTVLSLLERRIVEALNGAAGPVREPSEEELESFGRRVMRKLHGGAFRLVESRGAAGGGSQPDGGFPSRALELEDEAAERVGGAGRAFELLRRGEPPLLASMREGRLIVDLAALAAEDPAAVAAALSPLCPPASPPPPRRRRSGSGESPDPSAAVAKSPPAREAPAEGGLLARALGLELGRAEGGGREARPRDAAADRS